MTGTNTTDTPPRRGGMRAVVHTVLTLLVLAAGGAAAYRLMTTDEPVGRQQRPEPAARLVEVATVSPADHRITVTAHGDVQPSRRLVLRPRVGGRVTSLAEGFDPGGRLNAGDTALTLDDEDYRLALQRARAALTRARSDLALEQGQQAVARQEYEILGDESPAPEEKSLMLREPQLDSARAAVASARSDVAAAQRDLDHTTVTVPFDAVVLSRDVAPGAEVTTSTQLGELAGTERWWVELTVPVRALRWIDAPDGQGGDGSAVRLHYDAAWAPGEYRQGRVIRVLDSLEEDGRLARVLVAVDDPLALEREGDPPRLLIGAFVRGEILGRVLEDAYEVRAAWLHGGDTLWLMSADGELVFREVTVAYRDGDRVFVSGGLEPGDRVVTSGIATPAEGMPLRAAEAESGDGG
ncbi:efflux RND transporter periplasmic adaptor subunit [Arhodomonas aquaeolei]|uniref:efflux RND transporter periplasmic adaptor subunit n=1 Tax=Arhodomonas aquaeolei TaxID=2369 RepID=UPI0003634D97|nr:efflux RND transporter periplasmic adaptor subunit [Arhodomonas aquaeolei]